MDTKKYIRFIKTITGHEIRFIAGKDYGADCDKHENELKKLIFEQNGVLNGKQFWYPYEVVELCRWSCEKGHEKEFVVCNVIICLSIIAGTDVTNDPAYMKEALQKEYDKLDKPNYDLIANILTEAIKTREKRG